MVNRKGILRLIEAVLAITVIAAVLIIGASKGGIVKEKDLNPMLNSLLDEVAKNSSFREGVLNSATAEATIVDITAFLKTKLPEEQYSLVVKNCVPEDVCGLPSFPEDAETLYAAERIISAGVQEADVQPTKLKLFVWRR